MREVHDEVVRNHAHRKAAVRRPVDLVWFGEQRRFLSAEKYLMRDNEVQKRCPRVEKENSSKNDEK